MLYILVHKRDALGPKRIPSAWNKFLTEFFTQAKADGRILEGQKIVAVSADARAAYNALTPEQQKVRFQELSMYSAHVNVAAVRSFRRGEAQE